MNKLLDALAYLLLSSPIFGLICGAFFLDKDNEFKVVCIAMLSVIAFIIILKLLDWAFVRVVLGEK